jgi:hypothetical protein
LSGTDPGPQSTIELEATVKVQQFPLEAVSRLQFKTKELPEETAVSVTTTIPVTAKKSQRVKMLEYPARGHGTISASRLPLSELTCSK